MGFRVVGFLFVFLGCGTEVPRVRFVDVTAQAGISFNHTNGATGEYFLIETYGSGGGFFDSDGDGDLDVYLVNGFDLGGIHARPVNLDHRQGEHYWVKRADQVERSTDPAAYNIDLFALIDSGEVGTANVLYRNNGDGTFADISREAGVDDRGYGMGCAATDYDNDGDRDLYVTNFGLNVLYRNNGDGTFADVTVRAGVEAPQWSTSAAFFDYDNDGYLDLYVVNNVDFTIETNKICGGFVGTTPQGLLIVAEKTRSYCAPAEYAGVPDVLYRNNGDGTFADVSAEAGVDKPAGKGLGGVAWDFDEDGDQDLFVANDGVANFLYRNDGDGTFTDVALQMGVAFNGEGDDEACMGVDFGDYDGDGDLDLFVTNFSYETNTLFRNDGSGHFAEQDTSAGAWFLVKQISRGAAFGDYDEDGDIDLLVTNCGGRARLVRNEGGNARNWLMVKTVGRRSNRDGVGARVKVVAGDLVQIGQVRSGSSYLSINDPRVHFGLGSKERVDWVEVRWPSGIVQRIEGVAANQVLVVEERGDS